MFQFDRKRSDAAEFQRIRRSPMRPIFTPSAAEQKWLFTLANYVQTSVAQPLYEGTDV
jgi:hypothetical protein